jgi:predicted nucleic acid-binding protein
MVANRTLVLSPQSLDECYRVIVRQRQLITHEEARRFIASLSPACTAPAGFKVTKRAWQIEEKSGFSWWDCLLLASASLAGCKFFLSEDLPHQHRIGEMTIINPFIMSRSEILLAL